MKKKNYNPFEMLGSWIVGMPLMFILIIDFFDMNKYLDFISKLNIPLDSINILITLLGVILIWFIFLIPGFLIGWGIHSLIRRFKK